MLCFGLVFFSNTLYVAPPLSLIHIIFVVPSSSIACQFMIACNSQSICYCCYCCRWRCRRHFHHYTMLLLNITHRLKNYVQSIHESRAILSMANCSNICTFLFFFSRSFFREAFYWIDKEFLRTEEKKRKRQNIYVFFCSFLLKCAHERACLFHHMDSK